MGGWTTYGKQQIFQAAVVGDINPVLYLALFEASANPSGSPVELTLGGYTRRPVYFNLSSPDNAENTYDVQFGPLTTGEYQGVAILDDPMAPMSTNCWFWNDETAPITISSDSTVDFPAGQITVVRM